MMYRTRTYLAGDWDGDSDLIQQILKWNENDYLTLNFSDAHDLQQARDTSLNCSIKKSLSHRLNASKVFVLVVGNHTNTVTKGSCQYCDSYSKYFQSCRRYMNVDFRSFIKYECEMAESSFRLNGMKIVVIYNSLYVHREKCPEILKNIGKHIAGKTYDREWNIRYDYQAIKDAIMEKEEGDKYGR
ncbi:hypothetical protein SAMN04487934_11453 [Eubacterium ruminantium]|nr:hypothetical protein SAMN04487934_11453 [Eubacterium ruminantium]